jgi:hypothetical protein
VAIQRDEKLDRENVKLQPHSNLIKKIFYDNGGKVYDGSQKRILCISNNTKV